jgi:hypothetical protein
VGVQQMDPDVAESVAGVVRLLRRAARLVWTRADLEGPRSARQLLGLGIDLVADEARNLLADRVSPEGPEPVGEDPAGLLRSAARLLQRVCESGAPLPVHALNARVSGLVWEANTGAGG